MWEPLDDHDPRHAGPYQLRARIGAGGMGRVYLAQTPGGRRLAIKIVRAELADDSEFRQRFRQEVNAARKVHGAFTAELIDADIDGAMPWLATVYIPGMSLQQAVTEFGPLPAPTAYRLLAGVSEALQAIHAAGVIHRDLKPANVLLAMDGPRVIDFGIARAGDTTPVTRTGIRVGSPQFMAPEHASGQELTPAADVFALGALAVFAATGATPFGEGPDAAVLYRVVNEQPTLGDLTDPELRELVAACLDKNPQHRPTPAEIIERCAAAADPTLADGAGWLPEPVAHEAHRRAGAVLPALPEGAPVVPRRTPRRRISFARSILAVATLIAVIILSDRLPGDNQTNGSHGNSPTPITPTAPEEAIGPPNSSPDTTTSALTASTPTAPTAATTTRSTPHSAANSRPAPPAAHNATATVAQLGTPDWNGYCETTGQGPVQLIRNDAYGWHCSADNGTGDDAKAVCDWTFGTTQTTNRVANFYDPNSWQCWHANRELGPVNFTAYCQAIGFPGVYYVSDRHAYGWFCTNDHNGLDLQDACLRLYGSSPPVSRFQNFYDPNSWQCWG